MDFIFEHKLNLEIKEALEALKRSLKTNGFGTLYELNFRDKFREHNLEYPNDYYVLEVCNPKLAHQILDISETIGYFLPCKVVVRSDQGGTIVGMIRPANLLHMVTNDVRASEIALEVENIIKKAIKETE